MLSIFLLVINNFMSLFKRQVTNCSNETGPGQQINFLCGRFRGKKMQTHSALILGEIAKFEEKMKTQIRLLLRSSLIRVCTVCEWFCRTCQLTRQWTCNSPNLSEKYFSTEKVAVTQFLQEILFRGIINDGKCSDTAIFVTHLSKSKLTCNFCCIFCLTPK